VNFLALDAACGTFVLAIEQVCWGPRADTLLLMLSQLHLLVKQLLLLLSAVQLLCGCWSFEWGP
jgi:hypothetical protein